MASVAIHGLVFVSLAVDESARTYPGQTDSDMRVSVELLGDISPPDSADHQLVRQQSPHQTIAPLPTPQMEKRVAQPTVRKSNLALVSRADAGLNMPRQQIESIAQAANRHQSSPEPVSNVIRQHLESFKYYPASARRRGIEGDVDVAFTLALNGHADAVSILHGSGYAVLDQAALDTVQRAQPFPVDQGHYRFRLRFSRL